MSQDTPSIFDDTPVDYSSISPDVIRTIAGESSADPARVATVLRNRQIKSGLDYSTLTQDPAQFAARTDPIAWAKNSKLDPNSTAYQRILNIAGPILTGQQKPLDQSDMFYNPQTMKDGAKPNWDDGTGALDPLDKQLYFTNKYVPPTTPSIFEGIPENPVDPGVTDLGTGKSLPDAQTKAARILQNSGDLVTDPKSGSTYKGMPLYYTSGSEQPSRPGDYWLDPTGKLNQVPVDYNAGLNYANGGLLGFGNKLMAGVQALKATAGNTNDPMFGDYYNQALGHYDQAKQMYTQEHPVAAGVTQGLGSLQTTLPIMAAGGEALAPVRSALGPLGDFVAGATKGNPFAQFGSQATSGALQGGSAAGLNAGEDPNHSFGQQVFGGALTGGLLNPTIHGLASGFTNTFLPKVTQPVADLADKALNKFGINLNNSQILAGDLQGTRVAASADQIAQRQKAIVGTFGGTEPTLTDPVMAAEQKRIGGNINTIAARNTIYNTGDLQANLDAALQKARDNGLTNDQMKPLVASVKNIKSKIGTTGLPGTAYSTLIARDSPLDLATRNSDISHYAVGIRNVLDDAFDAEAAPGDAEAMQQARGQYKAWSTVRPIVDARGQVPLDGSFATAVKNSYPMGNLHGNSDLVDLAKIDSLFMQPPSATKGGFGGIALNNLTGSAAGAALVAHNPLLAGKIAAGGVGTAIARHYLGTPLSDAVKNLNPFLQSRLLQGSGANGPSPLGDYLTNQFAIPTSVIAAQNAAPLIPKRQGTN